LAEPEFQPLDSKRFFLALRIVIALEYSFAGFNHSSWNLLGFFAGNLQDDDRIWINAVHDPPSGSCIADP